MFTLTLTDLFSGLALVVTGLIIVIKYKLIVANLGEFDLVERYFGYKASYTMMRLFGLTLIAIGVIILLNKETELIEALLSPF